MHRHRDYHIKRACHNDDVIYSMNTDDIAGIYNCDDILSSYRLYCDILSNIKAFVVLTHI